MQQLTQCCSVIIGCLLETLGVGPWQPAASAGRRSRTHFRAQWSGALAPLREIARIRGGLQLPHKAVRSWYIYHMPTCPSAYARVLGHFRSNRPRTMPHDPTRTPSTARHRNKQSSPATHDARSKPRIRTTRHSGSVRQSNRARSSPDATPPNPFSKARALAAVPRLRLTRPSHSEAPPTVATGWSACSASGAPP
jgi:hypothetical protein